VLCNELFRQVAKRAKLGFFIIAVVLLIVVVTVVTHSRPSAAAIALPFRCAAVPILRKEFFKAVEGVYLTEGTPQNLRPHRFRGRQPRGGNQSRSGEQVKRGGKPSRRVAPLALAGVAIAL
jgi:hypothetical protein